MPSALYSCNHKIEHSCQGEYDIKVASIHLAYDNCDLLHLLRKRGSSIIEGARGKTIELEQKIHSHIQTNQEKIVRPVTAFVILENQECHERCLKHFVTSHGRFGNI